MAFLRAQQEAKGHDFQSDAACRDQATGQTRRSQRSSSSRIGRRAGICSRAGALRATRFVAGMPAGRVAMVEVIRGGKQRGSALPS
jgi:hypothetical protein